MTLRPGLGVFFALVCASTVCLAAPAPLPLQTLSLQATLESGSRSVTVFFPVPGCPAPQVWLLKQIQVGPEIDDGSTAEDLVTLPPWGVSAAVHQTFTMTTVQVQVVMVASGPQHVSTSIEGGQPFDGSVHIKLLGGAVAAARYEFNLHVTGQCGVATSMP
jgi:hypothetical protein